MMGVKEREVYDSRQRDGRVRAGRETKREGEGERERERG